MLWNNLTEITPLQSLPEDFEIVPRRPMCRAAHHCRQSPHPVKNLISTSLLRPMTASCHYFQDVMIEDLCILKDPAMLLDLDSPQTE